MSCFVPLPMGIYHPLRKIASICRQQRTRSEHQEQQPSAKLTFSALLTRISGDPEDGSPSSDEDWDTRPWAPRCNALEFLFLQDWLDKLHIHRQHVFAQLCPAMKSLAFNIISYSSTRPVYDAAAGC